MKPHIFISYTNQDVLGPKVSERLFAKLEAAGFKPLRDKERLAHGDKWHEGLDGMINECHGAIVVLSYGVSGSDWVKREALLLSNRKRVASDFVLLPILVGGAQAKDFGGLGLEDLKEFQSRPLEDVADFVDNDPTLAHLKANFGILEPEARLQREIESKLRGADPVGLINMADKLGVDNTGWSRERNLSSLFARILAAAFLKQPIGKVAAAMEFVLSDLGEQRCKEILKLLASNWVPTDAARKLREATNNHRRCFALNDPSEWTHQMYLRSAKCYWNPWKSLRVLGVDGGEDEAIVLAGELRREWASTVNSGSWEEREKVVNQDLGEPVFAVIPRPSSDQVVKDLLNDKCTGLTLLMTDEELGPEIINQHYPSVSFLSPPLTEGQADGEREKNRAAASELKALVEKLNDNEL